MQLEDSQPFVASEVEEGPGPFAFCHNGFLRRHDELRAEYAPRLQGRADSEVGFRLLEDLLGRGVPPEEALVEVHARLEGSANFSYLDDDGRVLVYAGHDSNPMWTFRVDGVAVAASAIHSSDQSLFDLIFQDATDRRVVAGVAALEPPQRGASAGARRDGAA